MEVAVSAHIARPREHVFEYLADVANHAEFTDHYLENWRLTREDSYGTGAGARFRITSPLNRFSWGDLTIAEMQPPYRVLMRGRCGKYNRIRMIATFTLSPGAGDSTRVEYTFETEPAMPSDKLREALIDRGWTRRRAAKSLRRLRTILEENRDRGRRATVAAR